MHGKPWYTAFTLVAVYVEFTVFRTLHSLGQLKTHRAQLELEQNEP